MGGKYYVELIEECVQSKFYKSAFEISEFILDNKFNLTDEELDYVCYAVLDLINTDDIFDPKEIDLHISETEEETREFKEMVDALGDKADRGLLATYNIFNLILTVLKEQKEINS